MNTVDICPVGALVSSDFLYQTRVWNLKSADSMCSDCAVGLQYAGWTSTPKAPSSASCRAATSR
jgi:NADH-quinone oxidoreductase subunit G